MYFSRLRVGFLTALATFLLVQPAAAQNVKMPSSLKYGTGLLDIPVASVLPHLAITGTYSGFGMSVHAVDFLEPDGTFRRKGGSYEKWLSDASIAIGLFDRVELGATIQHWDSEENGGNLVGGFGRLSLLPARIENLDLAVGARYVSSPTFGDRYVDDLQPNRFGYPDYRLRESQDFNGNLSPYLVGTALLPTSDDNFFSMTLGWGAGLFSAGGDLDYHHEMSSGGLFAGAGGHFSLGPGRRFNLMAEFNGFDANAGLQLDLGGFRVGAFSHGLFNDGSSTFRTRKLGVMASLAFCGARGGLCGAPPPPPPPPAPAQTPDPGPTAEELEAMRQDSIRRAEAEAEAQGRREAEAAERERQRQAMAARRTLEETVFFDYDDSRVRADAEALLRAKLEILRANPTVTLLLGGHADERGASEYNVALANDRAEAVRDFFANAGLDPGRFEVVSYGESVPRVQGASEEAWAQNRRVEFEITAGGDDIGRYP